MSRGDARYNKVAADISGSIAVEPKLILMVGPASDAKGGIAAVISTYRVHGLFDRWPMVHIVTHSHGSTLAKLRAFLKAIAAFITLGFRGRIGLVHIHMALRSSFYRKAIIVMLSKLFRVPVLLHLHAGQFPQFYDQECGFLRRRWIAAIFGACDRVIVLSKEWRQLISSIVPARKIEVMHNPVSTIDDDAAVSPRGAGLSERGASILFLGEVCHRKGSYDLVRAVAALERSSSNFRITFGGTGEVEQVRALAKELGVMERIEFLGWVSGQDKNRLLSEASVYVLPSYAEGLPMSVLEAMSFGLPVISTPVGGIPDAIENGKEGILVPPGDIEGLTVALETLLGDSELCRSMGEAARRKCRKKFNAEKIISQLEDLYRKFGLTPTQEGSLVSFG